VSEPQNAGPLVDALGLQVRLDEGELVDGAILILKIHQVDRAIRLSQVTTDGLSWIESIGMLRMAERVQSDMSGWDDCDDD